MFVESILESICSVFIFKVPISENSLPILKRKVVSNVKFYLHCCSFSFILRQKVTNFQIYHVSCFMALFICIDCNHNLLNRSPDTFVSRIELQMICHS